ncbi:MAG: membrane protein insertase YidC [Candidatus Pacebacteria bacterium]|nr:membrane protein insertase YidC [Candidatus Paceibacterota bacterium]
MTNIFNTFLYEPLYNTLIYLIAIVPGHDVGAAIIVLTIAVKFLIFPLTHKQSTSQRKIKKIEPQAQEIREKHKNDKQEQARKIMELYREHGVNPFSGCLLMLIQMPIIIALYWVFYKGGLSNGINTDILYPFVVAPDAINMLFLNVFDLGGKSVVLALMAGVSQFFQMKLAMPAMQTPKVSSDGKMSFKDEFAKNMNTQFKYVLPGIVFFFAYSISAAVALYWVTSNIFSIVHELVVKHKADEIISNKEENNDAR